MPLPDALDQSAAHSFRVKIDGIALPRVLDVSGLKLEVDKVEMKAQTEDGKYIIRNLIGRPKPGELTITRGVTDSKAITDWWKSVVGGDLGGARKTASVELLDFKGTPIKTYNFRHCWVKSVEIGSLKAGATEAATEKFTISFDEAEVV